MQIDYSKNMNSLMNTPKHKLCNICILATTIIVWNNFYPVEQISVPHLFVVTVTQSKCNYFSSSLSSRWSCDQSSVLHRRVVFASMAIWIWTFMVTEMGALCVKYSRPGRSEWVNGWMNEATVCWHTHTHTLLSFLCFTGTNIEELGSTSCMM